MNKKLIALDLDGTLLNSDGIVSEISKSYFKKIKEQGHIITIATGRILKDALIGTEGAEFANYIVSDTGAAVFRSEDTETKWKEVYINQLSKETVQNIASYYDKNKFTTIEIRDRNSTHHYDGTINIMEILEKVSEITHLTVVFLNNEFAKEYLDLFKSKFPNLEIEMMQDSFGDKKWLDILQKGVEKYKGITEVAKLEGISNENIIAFGDGLNDIEMLKKCGVGVAIKNALPEVKEQADYITSETNNQNGVVEFLKEYLVEI